MQALTRDSDTICAVSTPPGHGALAVVRVSGTDALNVCRKLLPFLPVDIESHRVYYGHAVDPKTRKSVDEVLATYFARGRSFTGEETIEISTHGSPAITAEMIKHLIECGSRLAEKGEFTFRAFRNGRIDLVQAESVLALIESRSSASARMALRQLQGELTGTLKGIEENLIWLLSRLEANIDFAQEDIEFETHAALEAKADQAQEAIRALLSSYQEGRILRQGLKVVLAGATNAGKSSLLNRLVGYDRAIVSPEAGTTRDYVEASMSISGQQVTFIDTAGLRETSDTIERMGMDRTRSAIADADVVIYVQDISTGIEADLAWLDDRKPVIWVANKVDLKESVQVSKAERPWVYVSAATGQGIDVLKGKISEWLPQASEHDSPVLLQSRHYELLRKADFHMGVGSTYLKEGVSPEIVIAEINEVLGCIFELTGKTVDEEVLDRIFSDFCLGK